jgi:hypothetical protein
MTVPVTAMNKNDLSEVGKYKVGLAGKLGNMRPKFVPT